ncbi:protein involved in polysaccharide export with SLBB domain [Idiomarina fontislapidosi]|uniref:Capsid assembly protein n=1 Tax=Idiomarina fontislapidosi TaxID=263723 RepID=A0A432XQW0_9GAMM|nr:polysaccharide biosynthesis/export family protein [Idiomarina fontislapidosi]PYE30707.1 protein involved in polysaccharide export with SLBB domain [Idiomarina fontislapidosi]RUO51125.1 capsid assembly protein [Idiomarina fontislapidosi]
MNINKQGIAALLLSFVSLTASAQSISDLSPEQREQLEQRMGSNGANSNQAPPTNVSQSQVFGDVDPTSPLSTQFAEQQVRSSWSTGTYGPVMEEMLSPEERNQIRPFGAEVFDGGFRVKRSDGLNPQYRILPGDQITLRVWGATEVDSVLSVDAQGFVFIPSVGPVQVQGVTAAQLNSVITSAIKTTYPKNVNVYTNVQGVQPVGVMVSGYVERPGKYAGVPSDSILYFLDQASGIDNKLGSFRNIDLIRNGEVIKTFDLYDFLIDGELNQPQLQEGDTLLVKARGPQVTVYGDVGRAYHYELAADGVKGSRIEALARLNPGVSHALVVGTRMGNPVADYLTINQFADTGLADGDEIAFFADKRADKIVVQVEGKYLGQSYFVLPKNARLMEFLNTVAVDPQETDYKNISIRRQSVAERQKKALEESLDRLEQTYLGAPSSTAEEAAVRAQEAELISQFVQKARNVKPSGRLVVSNEDQLVDIRLQHGDVVTLPAKTDSVLVSGEVYVPQSAVFVEGKSVEEYINGAGGFTQRANDDRILIVRQNGEVIEADNTDLRPGDEVLVLPAVSSKNLQVAQSITQIIYQIAVATKVALDL